jgi:tetratricopeptide (TPR) repeat protein
MKPRGPIAAEDPREALRRIERELALEPRNPRLHLLRAQSLLALGRKTEAAAAADRAEQFALPEAAFWDALGSVFSFANEHRRALRAYDQAIALAPNKANYVFNRAAVRRFVGELDAAESDYDRALELDPQDFEAYKNRSDLRTQTGARNHVAELEAALARTGTDWRGEVQIRYALAKECEDLGLYAQSFAHLRAGARRRREHLRYDVAQDVATVDWIIEAFPQGPAPPADADAAARDAAPIFIVGLPRSGTTLVERILASHSQVRSGGELRAFAACLVAAAGRRAGRSPLPRRELVAVSATLDFAALGREYLAAAHAEGGVSGRFIDKMPLNYLYCGLIARALPQAKIVHLHRHPMAACYAMYKSLFRDGYPFSYDLEEIGRYYVAYRRLMEHWQRTMPGVILSLSYESLVADPIGRMRELLSFCGLDWEHAVTRFHDNPAPSTTASAAQVRRPIYDSSVAQWRHYAHELSALEEQLRCAGIAGLDAAPRDEQSADS